MAVLKGLKVYIEVNSRPLPESTPASQEQSPSKVLRNVEVIAGQKFAVRCKIPEGFCDKPPISAYSIRLYVNGEFADAGVYLNAPRDDAFRGRIHYEAGKQIVRAFKFEKIQIDEEARASHEDLARKSAIVADLGLIQLDIVRAISVQNASGPSRPYSAPEDERIPKRAITGVTSSFKVGFGEPKEKALPKFYSLKNLDSPEEPYARFVFRGVQREAPINLRLQENSFTPSCEDLIIELQRRRTADNWSETMKAEYGMGSRIEQESTETGNVKRRHSGADDDDEIPLSVLRRLYTG